MKTMYADTFFKKILGLMFRTPRSYCMVFDFKKSSREPVHTWFCRMPLTIMFLSVTGELEVYDNVPPYRFVYPKNSYIKIIEVS